MKKIILLVLYLKTQDILVEWRIEGRNVGTTLLLRYIIAEKYSYEYLHLTWLKAGCRLQADNCSPPRAWKLAVPPGTKDTVGTGTSL